MLVWNQNLLPFNRLAAAGNEKRGSAAGEIDPVGGLSANCGGGLDFVPESDASGGELNGVVELSDSSAKSIEGDGWLLGAAK